MSRRATSESDVRTTVRVLRRHVGRSWPIIVVGSLVGARSLVRSTAWGSKRGQEAEYVRRIVLGPALYIRLKRRLGPARALAVLREILLTIGVREMKGTLESIPNLPADPMDRVGTFNEVSMGLPPYKFMPRTPVQTPDRYSFQLTNCVMHEFFTAVGTPELTQLFCEMDEQFFPAAFPELAFHRDGAPEHTIGRGNATCEFVFDRKEPTAVG